MSNSMSLCTFIDHFTQSRSLERCIADHKGCYTLYVDGEHPIVCYQKKDVFIFLCGLDDPPDDPTLREEYIRRMMKIHFGRCRHHPEMLAYDGQEKRLVIHRQIDSQDLPQWRFDEILEEFAASTSYWHQANKGRGETTLPPIF